MPRLFCLNCWSLLWLVLTSVLIKLISISQSPASYSKDRYLCQARRLLRATSIFGCHFLLNAETFNVGAACDLSGIEIFLSSFPLEQAAQRAKQSLQQMGILVMCHSQKITSPDRDFMTLGRSQAAQWHLQSRGVWTNLHRFGIRVGKICAQLAWEAQHSFEPKPGKTGSRSESMDIKELWIRLQACTVNKISFV